MSKKQAKHAVPTSVPVRRLLTISEAAAYLGASNWFVEQAARTGEIPSRWMGDHRVFDIKDLDDFIEGRPYAAPVIRQKKKKKEVSRA